MADANLAEINPISYDPPPNNIMIDIEPATNRTLFTSTLFFLLIQ